ncbi:hypothetical protein [Streptomyces sp. BH055]|uniref:hypothetical protein n=1 Tax=Streptomyces sp. BH055 TaxID=3401173 RepID=UPI003BB52DA0
MEPLPVAAGLEGEFVLSRPYMLSAPGARHLLSAPGPHPRAAARRGQQDLPPRDAPRRRPGDFFAPSPAPPLVLPGAEPVSSPAAGGRQSRHGDGERDQDRARAGSETAEHVPVPFPGGSGRGT